MAFVFKLVEVQGNCNCEGCAGKMKECVRKVKGVKSVVVKRIQDDKGDYKVTIIVKGSFNPEKIILGVNDKLKRAIELVSSPIENDKVNQVEPIKAKSPYAAPIAKNPKDLPLDHDLIVVEPWEKLDKLADSNLVKAQRLKGLENECEDLKARFDAARARHNELGKQKRDILNHDHRDYASFPKRSQGRKAKKKDESEVMHGKLATQRMKVDDFVREYKLVRIKHYEQTRQSPAV